MPYLALFVVTNKREYSTVNRGIEFIEDNKYEEALESVNNALDIKLGFKKFFVRSTINSTRIRIKAQVLYYLKKYDESIEYADEAIKSSKTNYKAWRIKGLASGQLGNYKEAIKCHDKILGKYPDAAETLNNKGYALAKIKNMIKILKCIDKALKLIPEMSIYWIVRDLSWKN